MAGPLRGWWPLQSTEELQLEDLDSILSQPEPTLGTATPPPHPTVGGGASTAHGSGDAVTSGSGAAMSLGDSSLPLSSGSQCPCLESPDKLERPHADAAAAPASDYQQQKPAAIAAAAPAGAGGTPPSSSGWADYLPSVAAAWLPSTAAAAQQQQQSVRQDTLDRQQQQPQHQQRPARHAPAAAQGGPWRDYLPAGASTIGSSLTAADGPPAAAASTAAPGWAAAAQHQLSAALDHTKEQLGAASSSGLGVAVLGCSYDGCWRAGRRCSALCARRQPAVRCRGRGEQGAGDAADQGPPAFSSRHRPMRHRTFCGIQICTHLTAAASNMAPLVVFVSIIPRQHVPSSHACCCPLYPPLFISCAALV